MSINSNPSGNEYMNTDRIRAVLKPIIPSINISYVEETKSTNTDLLKLADNGASSWTVLVAQHQTGGKGRHQRRWASPAGGLYASVLLKLTGEDSPVTLLPLTVGLALKESIEEEAAQKGGKISLRLKWPNDILTPNGKLAGILCETVTSGEEWVLVAGTGVNIHPLDSEIRRLILDPPASLMEEADLDWTRAGLLVAYLRRLHDRIADWSKRPDKIRADWMDACGMMGKDITVKLSSGNVTGVARGINDVGALQVQTVDGLVTINSAEGIEEHNGKT